jgi:hypothetical protein
MTNPTTTIEDLLRQHEAQVRERLDLLVRWLLGEINIEKVLQWDRDHRQLAYQRPEKPSLVWFYRPPELTSETYNAYNLLHKQVFNVGNLKFRKGSGRSTLNSATRHGRLNYQASAAVVREWFDTLYMDRTRFQRESRKISHQAGVEAFKRVPHWTLTHNEALYFITLVPAGYFQVYSGYEGHPPSLNEHSYSAIPTPAEWVKITRAIMDEQGCTWEEAREQADLGAQERSRALLADFLIKYGHLSKSHARGFVSSMGAKPPGTTWGTCP